MKLSLFFIRICDSFLSGFSIKSFLNLQQLLSLARFANLLEYSNLFISTVVFATSMIILISCCRVLITILSSDGMFGLGLDFSNTSLTFHLKLSGCVSGIFKVASSIEAIVSKKRTHFVDAAKLRSLFSIVSSKILY